MRISYLLASLTVLTLPLYTVRLSVHGLPTTILEISIGLTILSWFVETTWQRQWSGLWQRVNNPLLWLGVALVVWSLVEAWINPDHRAGLGLWRAYFAEPFVFGLVVLDLLRRGERARWLVYSLIGSGVWLSLMGLSQLLLHQPVTADSLHEVEQGRAAAVFNSANALALYLGPILALVVGAALKGSKKWWIVVLAILLGIASTKSRGALAGLGMTVIIAAVGWYWPRLSSQIQRWGWYVLGTTVVIGLAGSIILFLNISFFTPHVRFTYPRTFTDTKIVRLCLWEGTKQVLTDAPFFGTGLGNFQPVYFDNRTCDSEPLEYPHNILLNWWVSTGIVGLMLFLILQTRLFNLLRMNQSRVIALALAAGFSFWIIHGIVDVPYFKNDLAIEFWLLAILAIFQVKNKLI